MIEDQPDIPEKDPIETALEGLRNLPNFKVAVLNQLKLSFLDELSKLGDSSASEAEKHRGVVVFLANFYENLAGKPIVGDLD